MNQPKIAVIVPMYNVEPFLRECLDSIAAQSFTDFEAVLVDDGSPDNCGAIADEYAQRDKRFRVIHKVNEGVSLARRDGFLASTAPFVTFVDSDDILPEKALENLYMGGVEDDVDIVCASRVDDPYFDSEYISIEEHRANMIGGLEKFRGRSEIIATLYAKLFRRSIITENVFVPYKKAQDTISNMRLAFATDKRVKLVPKKVYCYAVRQGVSIMSTFKYTIEHLENYNRYMRASIPEAEMPKYAKYYIKNRIGGLMCVYSTSRRNVWHGTPYYADLLAVARQYNVHIPLRKRLFMSISNPLLHKLWMMFDWHILSRLCK